MKRVFCTISLVAALIATSAPAFAAGDRTGKPPEPLTPSTATVSQILKAFHAALGARSSSAAPVSIEDWSYDNAGTKGTEHLVEQGTDYYAHITYGPLTEDYGQFLGKGWHRDFNGVSTQSSGTDITSFRMLVRTRYLDTVDDPKNDLKVGGEVSSPRPAYVVSVTSAGWDFPDWYYFDKSTGLVDKIVRVFQDYTLTVTYEDYKSTDGLMRPTHIHAHYSDGTDESDYVRTSYSSSAAVEPKTFLAPPSQHAFVQYSGMSWLPSHMINRLTFMRLGRSGFMITHVPTMVVPLMVNGRRLDFGISSGLSRSIIDTGVAYELGLPTFGHETRGEVSWETVLPQATIGNLTLKNIALKAQPFHYHPEADTKIVGVLGADVLSAGVFKLDFTNGSMLFMPPDSYNGNSPDKKAVDVPVDIDDGRPFARGQMSGQTSSNFLIDNDFDFTAAFGSFTVSLPGWSNRGGEKGAGTTVPFADNRQFGRDIYFWPGDFDLALGPVSFQNIELLGTQLPLGNGERDIDAVIGSDVLRYFDMYLDYQHGHIFLKPNADYVKRFGTSQQGGR